MFKKTVKINSTYIEMLFSTKAINFTVAKRKADDKLFVHFSFIWVKNSKHKWPILTVNHKLLMFNVVKGKRISWV